MAAKIRKGDKVVVIAGRDKGKSGEVIKMLIDENRVLVRGVQMVRRHQRQTAKVQGGIVAKESSIHISNIALADPKGGKRTRVGFKVLSDGKKVRVAKRSGEQING